MSAVLISGANRGLGRVIAYEFARAGHKSFAGCRTPDDAAVLRQDAAREGLELHPVQLDVTCAMSIDRALEEVRETAGSLDVVVSNAGLAAAGPFELVSDATIDEIFQVNTFGSLRLIRAALSVMRPQGRGTIVAVTSLNAKVPAPGMSVYAASKAAVEAVVASLALEVEGFGIRVACVEPGPYRTQITDRTTQGPPVDSPYASLMAALRERTLRRLSEAGDNEEVGRAVLRAAFQEDERLQFPVGKHALGALGENPDRFALSWIAEIRRELARL